MGGGTDDAFAPYRRVPSSDPAYTVIMLAVPEPDGSFVDKCFCLPGHNFGLTSVVLNFNCLTEPLNLMCFSRRFLDVPVSRFFDDEGVREPSYAAGSGQLCHFDMRELIRFHSLRHKEACALATIGDVTLCTAVCVLTGQMTI